MGDLTVVLHMTKKRFRIFDHNSSRPTLYVIVLTRLKYLIRQLVVNTPPPPPR
jgi:hypothetical protein